MPHLLMYVCKHTTNFLLYLSVELRVQEYGTLKFPSIVILHVSLTRHIKLFASHKLFGKCFNVPPLTFRAIVRDLPTLLHKVDNAEYLMFHNCPIYSVIYCCGLCILLQWFRS